MGGVKFVALYPSFDHAHATYFRPARASFKMPHLYAGSQDVVDRLSDQSGAKGSSPLLCRRGYAGSWIRTSQNSTTSRPLGE
jgi:hypothetical protein